MDDDLAIPEFLRREPETKRPNHVRQRERKVPYPKDGYLGKGLREKEREQLRNRRRRHAEKCRQR